jgi:hypothetical protein
MPTAPLREPHDLESQRALHPPSANSAIGVGTSAHQRKQGFDLQSDSEGVMFLSCFFMIISSIVEDALNTGVLSPEQETTLYNVLRNYPCTEADLNALEVLLNKLVKREVRYASPVCAPALGNKEKPNRKGIPAGLRIHYR